MSGLDVEKEVILEVGVIITDMNFKELDTYHAILKQPQSFLDGMDEWNTQHHGESGLTAKVPNGTPPEIVEKELCELVKKHFDEPAVIAGNSIYQDRTFIKKHMLDLEKLLHYRMLDVSAWKLIFKEKYGYEHEKENKHRAIDDIKESIAELQAYLGWVKKPSQDSN